MCSFLGWLWRHIELTGKSCPGRTSESVFTSLVAYTLLGASAPAAANAVIEMFYHWNIRTPQRLGYVVQRSESLCIQHMTGAATIPPPPDLGHPVRDFQESEDVRARVRLQGRSGRKDRRHAAVP